MMPVALVQGVALTAAATVLYTVPSTDPKLKVVTLDSVRFVNTDTVPRTVTLYVVPAGGSPSVANTRIKTLALQPSNLGYPPAYFRMGDVMLLGTTIQALADAPSVVAFSANGTLYP